MCPAFIDVRIPRDTNHLSQENSVKKPIAGASKEFNMTRKIDAKNTFDLKQRKTKTFPAEWGDGHRREKGAETRSPWNRINVRGICRNVKTHTTSSGTPALIPFAPLHLIFLPISTLSPPLSTLPKTPQQGRNVVSYYTLKAWIVLADSTFSYERRRMYRNTWMPYYFSGLAGIWFLSSASHLAGIWLALCLARYGVLYSLDIL